MPSPDDERFEQYLKGFRPMAPPSLPVKGTGLASQRPLVVAILAVAAAVLVVATLMFRSLTGPNKSSRIEPGPVTVEQLMNSQPLTIHSANAMLSQAPSAKAAIDAVPFQSQKITLPKGQRSALAELSKETNKL